MTPHELNTEISRRASAGAEYQFLFSELVGHPQASWTDWVRCMNATDQEVQKEAWQRLSEVGFPEWSILSILGMPKTPEWVLPLAVSEVLSRDPNDLELCWLLYNTMRQNDTEFLRVVEYVRVERHGQEIRNYFGNNICGSIPPRIQEAVGDMISR